MTLFNSSKKLFYKSFFFAFCYGVLFYILQIFLSKTGLLNIQPTSHNLVSWDVGFYNSIRTTGYDVNSDNTGFFILFPLVWKISHLGVWGVTFLNIIFFSVGFAILMELLSEKDINFWLLSLTIPSIYFNFLPYTESLFFMLGTLVMFGIKKQKFWLIWLAIFLISLVRATTILLLPALLAMELLTNNPTLWWKSLQTFLLKFAIPSLLGLGLFILWQYHETGIWFAYFKKQSEHWGHTFTFPSIPFANIENASWRYHWLSALAMLIDLTALIWLIIQAFLWLKNKNGKEPNLVFSMGYLAMTLLLILCFNPKYGGNFTNVMGANRYTLATPFCIYFLHYFYKQKIPKNKILYFILYSNAYFALYRAFESLNDYILIGLFPTLIIIAFLFNNHLKKNQFWLLTLLIMFNFIIQMHLFQQFITPMYVD